jgi:hypothetical protein
VAIEELVEGPAWTGIGLEESAGRYPLRVETAVSRLVDRLLPGVITTTRHARMYCVHALAWAHAAEQDMDKTTAEDFVRRCEVVTSAVHHFHEPHRVALSTAHAEDRVHLFVDGETLDVERAGRRAGLSESGFAGVYQGPCVRIGALSTDQPPRRGPRARAAATCSTSPRATPSASTSCGLPGISALARPREPAMAAGCGGCSSRTQTPIIPRTGTAG